MTVPIERKKRWARFSLPWLVWVGLCRSRWWCADKACRAGRTSKMEKEKEKEVECCGVKGRERDMHICYTCVKSFNTVRQ